MKNQLDLLELLAHKRKVCRIHVKDLDSYADTTSMLRTLSHKLVDQLIPAIHDGTDNFYVYVGFSMEDIIETIKCDRHSDHKQLGRMFGYPTCCIKSFCDNIHIKSENDDEDFIYWTPAFEESAHVSHFQRVMNPDLNLLPHFPCSLRCSESINTARWRAQFRYSEPIGPTMHVFNNKTYEFSYD